MASELQISGLNNLSGGLVTGCLFGIDDPTEVTWNVSIDQIVTYINSHAQLTQAQVTGLTTASSPTFAGLSLNGALNMNSHLINSVTDPVNPQDAATKNYVDKTALNGTSVYAATATNLNVTQSGSGVGATLTDASGTFAAFVADGASVPVGQNVLVKNLSIAASHQGIYTLTTNGNGVSVPYVLTRATSYDTAVEINNTGLIVLQNGTTQAGEAWYNAATIVTVDTTNFSYSEYGNIMFPVTLAHGGTSAALTPSNGGIFYSTDSAGAILAGTATAGLALLSGPNTTPTWSVSPPITQIKTTTIVATGGYSYSQTPGTQAAIFELQAPGGGSGGGNYNAPNGSATGGGGGGAYLKLIVSGSANLAAITGNIGTAGTGGAAGQNNGTTAGNVTLTVNGGTQWVAGGGVLSVGAPYGVASVSYGGAGGTNTIGTNGTLIENIPGQGGGPGFIGAAAAAPYSSGFGGNSHLGLSGAPGAAAVGGQNYGSGATGAIALAGAVAGANGGQGCIIVTEFISV